jgi:predicted DNA binding CopG/RHH family protein
MPKKKLPDFKTPEEFDEWVETHDTSQYAFEDAPEVKIRPKKKPITLKVYPDLLYKVKAIAAKHKMPYQSLINQWLVEKAAEEKV